MIRAMLSGVFLGLLASCSVGAAPAELNGHWGVQQIAGASLGQGVVITMDIDAKAGTISGFSGCRNYSASLQAFGRALTVSDIESGSTACATPEAQRDEERFLGVLGAVQRYNRNGASLELTLQASGEALIRMREV